MQDSYAVPVFEGKLDIVRVCLQERMRLTRTKEIAAGFNSQNLERKSRKSRYRFLIASKRAPSVEMFPVLISARLFRWGPVLTHNSKKERLRTLVAATERVCEADNGSNPSKA